MNVEPAHIVAVIAAIIAAAGGYLTARRTTKPLEKGEETRSVTSLLSSYDAFSSRLQEDITRVMKDCENQIKQIRANHDHEREQWHRERAELAERIDELEGQVMALMERLSRRTDPPWDGTDRRG